MFQAIQFNYTSYESVAQVMEALSQFARVREGPGIWFFQELEGGEPFQFDCEIVTGGLLTARKGNYWLFLGHLVDALTRTFGAVEFGPERALPAKAHE